MNLGICKGPGKILGQFIVNSDRLNISKVGSSYDILMNGRTIFSVSTKKELIQNVYPVLNLIVSNLIGDKKVIKFSYSDKRFTELVDKFLDSIRDNTDPYQIQVLKIKPDEMQDNRTQGFEASKEPQIYKKLSEYKSELKKIGKGLENLHNTSDILLKTDLEKDIWGSENITKILNEVKNNIESSVKNYDKMDYYLEKSDDNLFKIQKILDKGIARNKIKEAAGNIVSNFSLIKSLLSKYAQNLYKLYIIDSAFKSYMGYPATWFFDGSIFMDFIFEYNNLLKNLIKLVLIEKSVIEPLLVWKITGAK